MHFLPNILIFATILCYVSAALVPHFPCAYYLGPRRDQNCVINKVEVFPYKEVTEDDPERYILHRGTNVTSVFDFTPGFNAVEMSAISSSETFPIDLSLPGQDTNACHFTTCPIEAGKKHTFSFTLFMEHHFPAGPYIAKWRLWNDKNEECCFTTKITIV